MELKNYLVFIGTEHPSGGWLDFKDSFETREEAKFFIEKLVDEDAHSWGQIIFIREDKGEEPVTEFLRVYFVHLAVDPSRAIIKEWSEDYES